MSPRIRSLARIMCGLALGLPFVVLPSQATTLDDDAARTPLRSGKGVQQQRSNRHMRVVARSLKLTKKARGRLLRIAERYFDGTGKKLVITGGDRSPRGQARLMYKKQERGEDLIELYARDDLVTEILDAYEDAKQDGLGTKGIINAMAAVIKAQVAEEQYVSRHLQNSAADVRSRGMGEAQFEVFRDAVRAEPGVRMIDERDTAAPHLHLNL